MFLIDYLTMLVFGTVSLPCDVQDVNGWPIRSPYVSEQRGSRMGD